ncbi:hypothetical protein [Sedimentisphaera salicampi]|uniref:hypothetical protein n=1 Tax=Sedimentisphaera salicampi TaxID=1941349 RepID=UPI000B9BB728|nr:hypothetical protein [Sedimentisphaera salicampi]OXU15724.1 hypothetical protein SMSP1_00511 [Sedimentisphaera salicampi]
MDDITKDTLTPKELSETFLTEEEFTAEMERAAEDDSVYERFEQVIESHKLRRNYERASRGDSVRSFQAKGISNEQLRELWKRYRRENPGSGYCFKVEQSCLVRW